MFISFLKVASYSPQLSDFNSGVSLISRHKPLYFISSSRPASYPETQNVRASLGPNELRSTHIALAMFA